MALKILSVFLLVAVLACPAVAGDAQRFVSVVDDLPLMDGLNEGAEGVEFTTPQGRLVEATATGTVSAKAVLDFYAETLPQLGWTAAKIKGANKARFVREGETLDLSTSRKAGTLSVRFSLAPTDK